MARRGDAVAAIVLAGGVALLAWTKFTDGDLGFHLATGREVLASHAIPRANVLSFTNPDQPWLLHYWLPDVLFEWSSRWGGVWALQLLKVGLVVATWSAAFVAARLAGAAPLPALMATLLGASAAAFRFELRPYLFTHLALAVCMACCARSLRADWRASRQAPAGLLLAGLMPALAYHFHAGAMDGWLLLAALAAGALLQALTRSREQAPGPRGLRDAGLVGLVLLASVALTAGSLALYHPQGARLLWVPFDHGADAYLAEHVLEFRPPFLFPASLLAPYWLAAALTLVLLPWATRWWHPFWLLAALGFLALSLKHARLAFGFAVVVVPLLALGLERALLQLRAALAISVAGLLLLTVIGHRYAFGRPGIGFVERSFPVRLFDYLDQHDLRGNVFASDAWAGPLLGHSYPRRRVFFDNRFEAYPRAFFKDVYQRVRYGQPGWDALLDRYQVEIVLMRYTSSGELRFQGGKANLRQKLARDARWVVVHFDDLGAIYLRRDGRNARHAREHALPGLDPDLMQFLVTPGKSRAGLRAALTRGTDSRRMLLMAATAEGDGGDPGLEQRLLQQAAAIPPFDGW